MDQVRRDDDAATGQGAGDALEPRAAQNGVHGASKRQGRARAVTVRSTDGTGRRSRVERRTVNEGAALAGESFDLDVDARPVVEAGQRPTSTAGLAPYAPVPPRERPSAGQAMEAERSAVPSAFGLIEGLRAVRPRRALGISNMRSVGRGTPCVCRERTVNPTRAPVGGFAGRSPSDAVGLLVDRFDVAKAVTALELISSNEELMDLAEESQDIVDRLGLGVGGASEDLETLTLVGVRALMSVAVTPAPTPAEVRRRATAYARQRCDARVATMLAFSLERDRQLHRMSIRDLA